MDCVPDLRLRRYPAWIRLALVIYAVSFLLPFGPGLFGWQVFYLGASVFLLPYGWPWLANPFLWFACGLARSSQVTAFVVSCLSWIASFCFLGFFLVGPHPSVWPGPAYWCWMASTAIAVIGSARELVKTNAFAAGDEADTRWTESTAARIHSPETSSEEYTDGPRA